MKLNQNQEIHQLQHQVKEIKHENIGLVILIGGDMVLLAVSRILVFLDLVVGGNDGLVLKQRIHLPFQVQIQIQIV